MKIKDHQIMNAIDELSSQKQDEWEKRFGDLNGYPDQHQRAEIQQKVKELFDIKMSKSGFRNRLKKLVDKNYLNKWHPFPRTAFYGYGEKIF